MRSGVSKAGGHVAVSNLLMPILGLCKGFDPAHWLWNRMPDPNWYTVLEPEYNPTWYMTTKLTLRVQPWDNSVH